MRKGEENFYLCPYAHTPLMLEIRKEDKERIIEGALVNDNGDRFPIVDGIPDLTWPKSLGASDQQLRETYENLANDYEKFASIPFQTYGVNEEEVRSRMVEQLDIHESSKVLEIGCGDGRGAEHIARRLGKKSKFYLQELSPAFLNKAMERLAGYEVDFRFSIANGSYLPFPDSSFDAAHHFGGMNTFSEVARFLKELARVVRPGGKVVVGDESMGPWLRETEFGRIMMNSNPLLRYEIPFGKIPLHAMDVRVEWVMQGAFFVLTFIVGEEAPKANYHIAIPSERGGSHWTRYYGNLEGITDETKKLAYEAREKAGISMHEWLDRIVKEAAKKELDE